MLIPALPDPPYNLTAYGRSPSSLGLSWQFNRTGASEKNLSSFFLFVKKSGSASSAWNVIGIPIHVNSFNVTDLHAVTTYELRLSVSTTHASGPASKVARGTTFEGGRSRPEGKQGCHLQSLPFSNVYMMERKCPSFNKCRNCYNMTCVI